MARSGASNEVQGGLRIKPEDRARLPVTPVSSPLRCQHLVAAPHPAEAGSFLLNKPALSGLLRTVVKTRRTGLRPKHEHSGRGYHDIF